MSKPRLTKVVLTLTLEEVQDGKAINFLWTCPTPGGQELSDAIREGEPRIGPLMTRVVDRLCYSLKAFENGMSEFGDIKDGHQ